jgi:hypothetical protein
MKKKSQQQQQQKHHQQQIDFWEMLEDLFLNVKSCKI